MKTFNQQLKNQFEIKSGQVLDIKKTRNKAIVGFLLFIAITTIIACLIQLPSYPNNHDMWSWIASIGVGAYGALCIFSWFDGCPSSGGY